MPGTSFNTGGSRRHVKYGESGRGDNGGSSGAGAVGQPQFPTGETALRRILVMHFDAKLETHLAAPHYSCPWPTAAGGGDENNKSNTAASALLAPSWGGLGSESADLYVPDPVAPSSTPASPLIVHQQEAANRTRASSLASNGSFVSDFGDGGSAISHPAAPVVMPWLALELSGVFPSSNAVTAAEHLQRFLDETYLSADIAAPVDGGGGAGVNAATSGGGSGGDANGGQGQDHADQDEVEGAPLPSPRTVAASSGSAAPPAATRGNNNNNSAALTATTSDTAARKAAAQAAAIRRQVAYRLIRDQLSMLVANRKPELALILLRAIIRRRLGEPSLRAALGHITAFEMVDNLLRQEDGQHHKGALISIVHVDPGNTTVNAFARECAACVDVWAMLFDEQFGIPLALRESIARRAVAWASETLRLDTRPCKHIFACLLLDAVWRLAPRHLQELTVSSTHELLWTPLRSNWRTLREMAGAALSSAIKCIMDPLGPVAPSDRQRIAQKIFDTAVTTILSGGHDRAHGAAIALRALLLECKQDSPDASFNVSDRTPSGIPSLSPRQGSLHNGSSLTQDPRPTPSEAMRPRGFSVTPFAAPHVSFKTPNSQCQANPLITPPGASGPAADPTGARARAPTMLQLAPSEDGRMRAGTFLAPNHDARPRSATVAFGAPDPDDDMQRGPSYTFEANSVDLTAILTADRFQLLCDATFKSPVTHEPVPELFSLLPVLAWYDRSAFSRRFLPRAKRLLCRVMSEPPKDVASVVTREKIENARAEALLSFCELVPYVEFGDLFDASRDALTAIQLVLGTSQGAHPVTLESTVRLSNGFQVPAAPLSTAKTPFVPRTQLVVQCLVTVAQHSPSQRIREVCERFILPALNDFFSVAHFATFRLTHCAPLLRQLLRHAPRVRPVLEPRLLRYVAVVLDTAQETAARQRAAIERAAKAARDQVAPSVHNSSFGSLPFSQQHHHHGSSGAQMDGLMPGVTFAFGPLNPLTNTRHSSAVNVSGGTTPRGRPRSNSVGSQRSGFGGPAGLGLGPEDNVSFSSHPGGDVDDGTASTHSGGPPPITAPSLRTQLAAMQALTVLVGHMCPRVNQCTGTCGYTVASETALLRFFMRHVLPFLRSGDLVLRTTAIGVLQDTLSLLSGNATSAAAGTQSNPTTPAAAAVHNKRRRWTPGTPGSSGRDVHLDPSRRRPPRSQLAQDPARHPMLKDLVTRLLALLVGDPAAHIRRTAGDLLSSHGALVHHLASPRSITTLFSALNDTARSNGVHVMSLLASIAPLNPADCYPRLRSHMLELLSELSAQELLPPKYLEFVLHKLRLTVSACPRDSRLAAPQLIDSLLALLESDFVQRRGGNSPLATAAGFSFAGAAAVQGRTHTRTSVALAFDTVSILCDETRQHIDPDRLTHAATTIAAHVGHPRTGNDVARSAVTALNNVFDIGRSIGVRDRITRQFPDLLSALQHRLESNSTPLDVKLACMTLLGSLTLSRRFTALPDRTSVGIGSPLATRNALSWRKGGNASAGRITGSSPTKAPPAGTSVVEQDGSVVSAVENWPDKGRPSFAAESMAALLEVLSDFEACGSRHNLLVATSDACITVLLSDTATWCSPAFTRQLVEVLAKHALPHGPRCEEALHQLIRMYAHPKLSPHLCSTNATDCVANVVWLGWRSPNYATRVLCVRLFASLLSPPVSDTVRGLAPRMVTTMMDGVRVLADRPGGDERNLILEALRAVDASLGVISAGISASLVPQLTALMVIPGAPPQNVHAALTAVVHTIAKNPSDTFVVNVVAACSQLLRESSGRRSAQVVSIAAAQNSAGEDDFAAPTLATTSMSAAASQASSVGPSRLGKGTSWSDDVVARIQKMGQVAAAPSQRQQPRTTSSRGRSGKQSPSKKKTSAASPSSKPSNQPASALRATSPGAHAAATATLTVTAYLSQESIINTTLYSLGFAPPRVEQLQFNSIDAECVAALCSLTIRCPSAMTPFRRGITDVLRARFAGAPNGEEVVRFFSSCAARVPLSYGSWAQPLVASVGSVSASPTPGDGAATASESLHSPLQPSIGTATAAAEGLEALATSHVSLPGSAPLGFVPNRRASSTLRPQFLSMGHLRGTSPTATSFVLPGQLGATTPKSTANPVPSWFASSACHTAADWEAWLRKCVVEMAMASRTPSLEACVPLMHDPDSQLWARLFPSVFLSALISLEVVHADSIMQHLGTAWLRDPSVPPVVSAALAHAADRAYRVKHRLAFRLQEVLSRDLVLRLSTAANLLMLAVHYAERLYASSRGNLTRAADLISLYAKLFMPVPTEMRDGLRRLASRATTASERNRVVGVLIEAEDYHFVLAALQPDFDLIVKEHSLPASTTTARPSSEFSSGDDSNKRGDPAAAFAIMSMRLVAYNQLCDFERGLQELLQFARSMRRIDSTAPTMVASPASALPMLPPPLTSSPFHHRKPPPPTELSADSLSVMSPNQGSGPAPFSEIGLALQALPNAPGGGDPANVVRQKELAYEASRAAMALTRWDECAAAVRFAPTMTFSFVSAAASAVHHRDVDAANDSIAAGRRYVLERNYSYKSQDLRQAFLTHLCVQSFCEIEEGLSALATAVQFNGGIDAASPTNRSPANHNPESTAAAEDPLQQLAEMFFRRGLPSDCAPSTLCLGIAMRSLFVEATVQHSSICKLVQRWAEAGNICKATPLLRRVADMAMARVEQAARSPSAVHDQLPKELSEVHAQLALYYYASEHFLNPTAAAARLEESQMRIAHMHESAVNNRLWGPTSTVAVATSNLRRHMLKQLVAWKLDEWQTTGSPGLLFESHAALCEAIRNLDSVNPPTEQQDDPALWHAYSVMLFRGAQALEGMTLEAANVKRVFLLEEAQRALVRAVHVAGAQDDRSSNLGGTQASSNGLEAAQADDPTGIPQIAYFDSGAHHSIALSLTLLLSLSQAPHGAVSAIMPSMWLRVFPVLLPAALFHRHDAALVALTQLAKFEPALIAPVLWALAPMSITAQRLLIECDKFNRNDSGKQKLLKDIHEANHILSQLFMSSSPAKMALPPPELAAIDWSLLSYLLSGSVQAPVAPNRVLQLSTLLKRVAPEPIDPADRDLWLPPGSESASPMTSRPQSNAEAFHAATPTGSPVEPLNIAAQSSSDLKPTIADFESMEASGDEDGPLSLPSGAQGHSDDEPEPLLTNVSSSTELETDDDDRHRPLIQIDSDRATRPMDMPTFVVTFGFTDGSTLNVELATLGPINDTRFVSFNTDRRPSVASAFGRRSFLRLLPSEDRVSATTRFTKEASAAWFTAHLAHNVHRTTRIQIAAPMVAAVATDGAQHLWVVRAAPVSSAVSLTEISAFGALSVDAANHPPAPETPMTFSMPLGSEMFPSPAASPETSPRHMPLLPATVSQVRHQRAPSQSIPTPTARNTSQATQRRRRHSSRIAWRDSQMATQAHLRLMENWDKADALQRRQLLTAFWQRAPGDELADALVSAAGSADRWLHSRATYETNVAAWSALTYLMDWHGRDPGTFFIDVQTGVVNVNDSFKTLRPLEQKIRDPSARVPFRLTRTMRYAMQLRATSGRFLADQIRCLEGMKANRVTLAALAESSLSSLAKVSGETNSPLPQRGRSRRNSSSHSSMSMGVAVTPVKLPAALKTLPTPPAFGVAALHTSFDDGQEEDEDSEFHVDPAGADLTEARTPTPTEALAGSVAHLRENDHTFTQLKSPQMSPSAGVLLDAAELFTSTTEVAADAGNPSPEATSGSPRGTFAEVVRDAFVRCADVGVVGFCRRITQLPSLRQRGKTALGASTKTPRTKTPHDAARFIQRRWREFRRGGAVRVRGATLQKFAKSLTTVSTATETMLDQPKQWCPHW